MRGRAYRRHKAEVHKDNAEAFLKLLRRHFGDDPTPNEIGIRAKTRVGCSCHMCGHQRECWGRPLREKEWFSRPLEE